MKIKLKSSFVAGRASYAAGQLVDLPDHAARRLIDRHQAELVDDADMSSTERAVRPPVEKTIRRGRKSAKDDE
ncbi:MAG: hypothetical protein RIB41_10070 [Oceanibaculum nanhaiense]|jgi:hypothetical protein|uniref:hypothetical protein n=1 Tax=Oceanibaculum nanhaiense TaxID=1909734 RepID=UPI0032EC499A